MSEKHFTARDLPFRDSDDMLLNQRTRAAFEYGVKSAARGLPHIYGACASDYREAEMRGYTLARAELLRGKAWLCRECYTLHSLAGGEP